MNGCEVIRFWILYSDLDLGWIDARLMRYGYASVCRQRRSSCNCISEEQEIVLESMHLCRVPKIE